MLFKDIVTLSQIEYSENDMGDITEIISNRNVFANKKSVRSSEFYQAMATGLKPELMFEVRTIEYQEETKLVYEGKQFNIIRVFDKNGEITELICEGVVNSAIT